MIFTLCQVNLKEIISFESFWQRTTDEKLVFSRSHADLVGYIFRKIFAIFNPWRRVSEFMNVRFSKRNHFRDVLRWPWKWGSRGKIQNFTFERPRRIRPNLTFNSDPLTRIHDKSPKLEWIYAILETCRKFVCQKLSKAIFIRLQRGSVKGSASCRVPGCAPGRVAQPVAEPW